MKKFPQVPFELNNIKEGGIGDEDLLEYLHERGNFAYLSDSSTGIINKLKFEKDKDFRVLQKELLELWPKILTDALLCLKKNDSREWDKKNEKMESFFDAKSLGTDELKDVLAAFSEFEGMMYGASPDRYRDHIAHSFRVWIIGQGILKEHFGGVLSSYEDKELRIESQEWECMWAIVALCHDIGYPLSAIEKINKRARDALVKQGLKPDGDLKFTFSPQMQPFHDTIIKLMASKPVKKKKPWICLKHLQYKYLKKKKPCSYLTHLQNKYYLKLLKSFDSLDHGIVSSLLISGSLIYFLESDLSHDEWKELDLEDARQFLIRREILRAIAAHTCPEIYHINFDTLSFLLYIVDDIQCWGRPTLEQLQHPKISFNGGYAVVEKFEKNDIVVNINTDDQKKWDDEQYEMIFNWVGKLKKMLRLAVGTGRFKENDSHLYFKVNNDHGQSCYIELKGGELIGPDKSD